MAAAPIELLTWAATLLLFAVGQHMYVHGSGGQILEHDPLVRAVVLVGSVDAACVPVRPEDLLSIHSHGEWVDGCAHNDLTVSPRKRATLNLLSEHTEMKITMKTFQTRMISLNKIQYS